MRGKGLPPGCPGFALSVWLTYTFSFHGVLRTGVGSREKLRMATATDRWHGLPRLAALLLALSLGGGMLAADAAAQSKNQAKKESAAAPQKDSAAVQRAYAAGTKAFEAGNMADVERQLSVALAGGGLPNPQMAKALYMRGTAYRQLGKPAQAISDLTTAVWLKGGLSETDKKAATAERQLAYREAGLGDTPPPVGGAPLDQGPTTTAAGAPAAAPGAQVANVGQQSFWSNFSLPSIPNPFASSEPAATPTAGPAPGAAAPVAAGFASGADGAPAAAPAQEFATAAAAEAAPVAQTSSWDTQTAAATEAAPAAQQVAAAGYAPVPEATGLSALPGSAPAAPQGEAGGIANPFAGAGTAISGFFGNVFGSGGSAAPQEASPVTTGSTAPASDWGSETTVTTAQTSSMVQRGPDAPVAEPVPVKDELPWTAAPAAAEPAAAKKVAAAKPAAGKYKLQVAAVRSREEAERLAQALRGYQAVQEGVVSPEVDEAVIGSMGTFYRVRLGPYADAAEPGQLCKTLKPQGFDCLVVTQ